MSKLTSPKHWHIGLVQPMLWVYNKVKGQEDCDFCISYRFYALGILTGALVTFISAKVFSL